MSARLGVDATHAEPGRTLHPSGRLCGRLAVVGDKSLSHRALILSALAGGGVTVTGLSTGEDVLATASALVRLGARIELAGTRADVGLAALSEPDDVLDCGNAGTSMRLLLGVAAGLPGLTVLTGDSSLRARPMGRVTEPLRRMGAEVWGRQAGTRAPLAIRGGRLTGVDHTSPVASAQVKSCLLLAGLSASGVTTVTEPHPSRDHTERMLRGFGAEVEEIPGGVSLRGGQALRAPRSIEVPGDISAAAFFAVGAAIRPGSAIRIDGVGINPTRAGLLGALRRAGAVVRVDAAREAAGEPVGDLLVEAAEVRPFDIEPAEVPSLVDELPVLAVLAAAARGVSEFRGAAELRAKESDRIATSASLLRALGADVDELPDGLRIHGRGLPFRGGGAVDARGDHRIAMSTAVAALAADDSLRLTGASSADTSFPGFFAALESMLA